MWRRCKPSQSLLTDENAVHIFNRLNRFCTSSVLIMLTGLFVSTSEWCRWWRWHLYSDNLLCLLNSTTSLRLSRLQQQLAAAAATIPMFTHFTPAVTQAPFAQPFHHSSFVFLLTTSLPADSNSFFNPLPSFLPIFHTYFSPTSAVDKHSKDHEAELQSGLNGGKPAWNSAKCEGRTQ